MFNSMFKSGLKSLRFGGLLLVLAVALGVTASIVLAFAQSSQVQFTLSACRLPDANHDGIPDYTLPLAGNFICLDADYTTGNLGKSWNELDLVPHRLTSSVGTQTGATTDYDVLIAADYQTNGKTGYDIISAPTVNTAKSDASCSISAGPQSIAVGQVTGGADAVIFRQVTIHQNKGTTCVFDYYQRLALGAHLFPGSSLQSYMFEKDDFSTGKRTLSIPVREILPQELRKDMSASQGSDHVWNLTKSPSPASLSFTNTCDPNASLSGGVQIQVTWEKLPAEPGGPVTVITHVYAINPASRIITVNVTDKIYEGNTQTTLLDTANSGDVDVPAGTNLLVLTHTFVWTNPTAGVNTLNDVATATYTDKVTGIPVPGNTTASASATIQLTGPVLNGSAVINDVESITGQGLKFSTDSFNGASGAFDGGYVAGTKTVGPVSWTSDSVSASGSVTFDKTIYVDKGTILSDGKLSDTATLTGSNGFSTTADASVLIDVNTVAKLTINKTIPNILQTGESVTFNFTVTDANNNVVATPVITFGAGETSKFVEVSNLAPGVYTVAETTASGFDAQAAQQVDLSGATCAASANFTNTAVPAHANVVKVTNPTGGEEGWEFKLYQGANLLETVTTGSGGTANFSTALGEGSYSVVETAKPGYDQTSATGCTFSVNLPGDANKTFTCSVTNTQRGKILVDKVTNPAGSAQQFEFQSSYGSNFFLTDAAAPNDSGALVPGTYSVAEVNVPDGWKLTGATCSDGSPISAINLSAGETVTCTFTNTQSARILVDKVTNPAGSAQQFEFDPSYGVNFFLTDAAAPNDSGYLDPGNYSVAEVNIPAGWDLTGSSCSDGSAVTAISLSAGETVTCTFTNTQRGKAQVIKTVQGAAPTGSQVFTFQLRQGASPTQVGTTLETQVANAQNGGVINFSTYLVPNTTYQLCEIVMPAWMTNLGTFVPNSFYPPDGTVANPNVDNSILCVNFSVAPGEVKSFTVDNTPPPGGRALTIGFWKNWASCADSGGKQKPVLDQTLAMATPPGIQVGLLTLIGDPNNPNVAPSCTTAVRLLNKSDIKTGKKMASDPLYNLAAQLVAAELNVAAGAYKCGNVLTAINSANALLVKYNFNGTGSYKLSAADATLANQLATYLDDYNNNRPNVCQ